MTDGSSGARPGLISDSCELYRLLEKLELLKEKPPMWWPGYGSFEVIVGAILTQNSQWRRVEASLENLRLQNCLDIDHLCEMDIKNLERLIAPSGLFKSKARCLHDLALAIREEFGDFESFCLGVEREWLLKQRGIGPETADSILCYACKRDAMVVDAYTARLLSALGYEFDTYADLQAWCIKGLFSCEKGSPEDFALFHGMIVEYVKANSKGKKVNIDILKEGNR